MSGARLFQQPSLHGRLVLNRLTSLSLQPACAIEILTRTFVEKSKSTLVGLDNDYDDEGDGYDDDGNCETTGVGLDNDDDGNGDADDDNDDDTCEPT